MVTLVPRGRAGPWVCVRGLGTKKNRDRICRNFGVFEVQNAIWEALGSVKASGNGKIFARLRRGLLYVVFCPVIPNLKYQILRFSSVCGGGVWVPVPKNRGMVPAEQKKITYGGAQQRQKRCGEERGACRRGVEEAKGPDLTKICDVEGGSEVDRFT